MFEHVLERGGEPVRARLARRHRRLHVLGLAALPVGWHHHAAGDGVGDLGSEVEADDMQTQVDARRRAGRGHDIAVVDIEHVGVDIDLRIAGRELLGLHPVGGGPAPVEQTGGGQHEGARADRQNPGPPPVRGAEGIEEGRGRVVVELRRSPGGNDDGVGPRDLVEAVGGVDGEALRTADGRCLGGADPVPVPGHTELRPVDPEHLARHRHLERRHPVADNGGHGGAPGTLRGRSGGHRDHPAMRSFHCSSQGADGD
jgi:hypothetical protein